MMKKKMVVLLLLSCFFTACFSGCSNVQDEDSAQNIKGFYTEDGGNVPEIFGAFDSVFAEGKTDIEAVELPTSEIELVSVGDIMSHEGQIDSARRDNGTYDFTAMLEEVAYCFEGADYVIGNLETTFAGAAKGYAGYPLFNTPETLGIALRDVLGVDLLSTANNHSLDCGYEGLVTTLNTLDEQGLAHTGTYRDAGEKPYYLADINGINVAFLSYTYGSNVTIRHDYSIHITDKEALRKSAAEAKEAGADYIILLIHWGVEYNREFTDRQHDLAEWIFAETDVQLIIGNHAHVVEPIEELTVMRDGKEKTGVVFYALGNFTGAQRDLYTDTGIIVKLKIAVDKSCPENSAVTDITYIPTFIDPNDLSTGKRYRVVTIDKVMSDYEEGNDTLLDSEEYDRIKGYIGAYRDMLEVLPYVHTEDLY